VETGKENVDLRKEKKEKKREEVMD